MANIEARVREKIAFIAFGNGGEVGRFDDTTKLSDLGLREEDYIELADQLTDIVDESNPKGSIDSSDLQQSGVTVGDVITLVKKAISGNGGKS